MTFTNEHSLLCRDTLFTCSEYDPYDLCIIMCNALDKNTGVMTMGMLIR